MFNILIVEDEVIQRHNLVSMASELGASVKVQSPGKLSFSNIAGTYKRSDYDIN